MNTSPIPALGLCAAMLLGCASINDPSHGVNVTQLRADERGFVAGLGIESQDLVTIADKMARGILGAGPVANAAGRPNIVIEPIVNDTRFPIDKDIFLTRIRVALNKQASGQLNFLARDRIDALEKERNLKLSGQVTGGEKVQQNEFKGADFILTGTFKGISSRGKAGASDYVLYTFQLLDPQTSDVVWEDFHEIKKQGSDDVTYR
ncbi:MAG: penicillin-binding protein activator LpoB [Verrucomicrobiales bacterium]|nr:penicillin-binding protein activator LpoB [Verrucomicrobiales bacterium]|tara:strand:+ start:128 stop:745 length:618 start_codon:yes stop_codon:yes gene_type:complete